MQCSVSWLVAGPRSCPSVWKNWAEFQFVAGFPGSFSVQGFTEVSRAALMANFNHRVSLITVAI
jgi:hypothetical protein